MSAVVSPSAFTVAALPDVLPLFPLEGVVLLPHGRLPLNIFEPRYLSMIDDVLGQGRMIGMIQPNVPEGHDVQVPPIYNVGCAGRITSFTETEDGRFLIGLTGLCRFTVVEELPADKLYRRARVDWKKFLNDLEEPEEAEIDRKRLMPILQNYFKSQGIAADWNAVQNTPNDMLIASLVMICPLAANEKQALLEAQDIHTRADMLAALLEMALMPQGEAEGGIRH